MNLNINNEYFWSRPLTYTREIPSVFLYKYISMIHIFYNPYAIYVFISANRHMCVSACMCACT